MNKALIGAGIGVAALGELLLYVLTTVPWGSVDQGRSAGATILVFGLFWVAAALALIWLANWLVAKGAGQPT